LKSRQREGRQSAGDLDQCGKGQGFWGENELDIIWCKTKIKNPWKIALGRSAQTRKKIVEALEGLGKIELQSGKRGKVKGK